MNRFHKQLLFIILGIVIITSGVLIVRAVNNRGNAPVAWWKFDEGYGQTVYDSAGSNDGTLASSTDPNGEDPTWKNEDDCKTGKCLYFDGVDDYVGMGDPASLSITGDMTISAWIRPSDISGQKTIAGRYVAAGDQRSYIFMQQSSEIELLINDQGTAPSTSRRSTNANLTANQWAYVAVVYDASEGSATLYKNGVILSDDGGGLDTSVYDGTAPFQIGGIAGAGYFNGFIDDIRIYDYARTAAQIKADYLASAGGRGASIKVGTSQEAQDPSEGLIAYWKMDESSWNGTADEVVDSSGSGNHGTSTSANTTSTAKYGRAGHFDGSNDYVDFGNDSSLDIESAGTVEAWVKIVTSDSNGHAIVSRVSGTEWEAGRLVLFTRNEKISFIVADGSSYDGGDVLGQVPITLNAWHHVVGTFDTSASKLKIYLDGDLAFTDTSLTVTPEVTGFDLLVGFWTGSGLGYFDGQIDDVKIYKTARTASQVRKDYETGPPPVAHWRFDEKQGQTVYDTSGANDGTLGADANVGTDDPTWKSAGHCKYGPCLSFDGSNDYVNISSSQSLFVGDFTFSAWLYSRDFSSDHKYIFAADYNNNPSIIFFYQNAADELVYVEYDGDVHNYFQGDGISLNENQWYYVTYTRAGTTVRIYVNGIEKGSDTVGGVDASSNDCQIGYAVPRARADSYFNGLIDDVRIYNYARTQKQIIEDMNAGHPAVGSPVGSYVGYWRFDEGYGSTTYDGSPHSNDGTLTGGVAWTTNGKFGKALDFDGENDYVEVDNHSSLQITGSLTIAAWAKRDTSGAYDLNIRKDNTAENYYEYVFSSDDSDRFRFAVNPNDDAGASAWYETTNDTVTDTNWHHLVGVFDSSVSDIKIYIDGVEKATTRTGTAASSIGDGTGHLRIGKASTHYHDGLIDELKIYPFALTPEEIKQEYNRGSTLVLGASGTSDGAATSAYAALREYCVPGDTSQCDPPVAHWKLDEKGGNTAYDTSGNGNHGSLNLDGSPATSSAWKSAGHCHQGSCLSFDGTDDYVEATDSSTLDGMDAITVGVWIKTTDNQNEGIVGKWVLGTSDCTDTSYFLLLLSTGKADWTVNLGASDETDSVSLTSVNDGIWHHVVGTYDGDIQKLYVDGVLEDTDDINNGTVCDSSTNLRIGYSHWLSDTHFNGSIDDVRIYNYARTPAQIAWDFNRGKPVAHWRMDENVSGDSQTLYDSSVHRNNGTTHWGANASGMDCTVAGKTNYGCDFDGTDDYVDLSPYVSNIEGKDTGTITGWFKFSGPGAAIFSISDGDSIGNFMQVMVGSITGDYPDESFGFVIRRGVSDKLTMYVRRGHTYYADSAWHHFAVVTGGGDNRIYIDGVSQPVTFQVGNSSTNEFSNINNPDAMTIGNRKYNNSYDMPFTGTIDDLKIFNYALTPEQIQMDYNQGAAHFAPSSGLP